MHARVTYVSIRPGSLEEAKRIYRESVMPAAETQDGFMGAMILADDRGETGISLTFWDSESSAAAAEANGYFQAQLAKFGEVLTGKPSRELYNVALNYTAGAVERSHL